MCFGIIKHFYYFELDILCFLELKADTNNLCTAAISNHTNNMKQQSALDKPSD